MTKSSWYLVVGSDGSYWLSYLECFVNSVEYSSLKIQLPLSDIPLGNPSL